ncbi:MAG TPA: ATP-binding protein [Cytophagaceae bacterium]|nr:ATP-binding protein [Cytophagaceae bacterium]
MTAILLTSGAVLLLTCATFFAYEYYTFRKNIVSQLSTIGQISASNSSAALAFGNNEDASEILNALKAEEHIIAASLYTQDGKLFSKYPANVSTTILPASPKWEGYRFGDSYLEGFQPVKQGNRLIGTLYLKSDLRAMHERFRLYGLISALVIGISFLMAFLLSKIMQKSISNPILALAETAKAISERRDYSVRAIKLGKDELGSLTDAFNNMLRQIETQNQELSRFNETLEQKVADRTLELKTMNKELESFSYSISHDLRAPLRSIHGYTNILSTEYVSKLDDEAKRLMNIILSNSKKMGQLIDDLLSFSRLGRKELMKQNIQMKNLVTEVWEELNNMEENRDIELILKDLKNASGDKSTIRQVWVNLISNALKFTRHQEKTVIEISAEEKEDSIIYRIRDNGTGFDMKYYDKLFGVFQRLHSQEEFEGTGVGLAIAHKIVAKHGGKIWADSKPNEGATFYFSLVKDTH